LVALVAVVEFVEVSVPVLAGGVVVSSFGPQPVAAVKITVKAAIHKTFFIYSSILLSRNAAGARAGMQAENSVSKLT
jgi:hypothetical protein